MATELEYPAQIVEGMKKLGLFGLTIGEQYGSLSSDVAAIRTRAVRDGDDFVLNGQKMWLTNVGAANLVAVLCRTDDGHDAPHRTVPGKIEKMGYKGMGTTELLLADVHNLGPKVPRPGALGCYPSSRRAAQA